MNDIVTVYPQKAYMYQIYPDSWMQFTDARPSGVPRRRSDGLECAAWRPPRPVAQCRQFQEHAKDAFVSECTWTFSALEALRNALYKFKTYLLTYIETNCGAKNCTVLFLQQSTTAYMQMNLPVMSRESNEKQYTSER